MEPIQIELPLGIMFKTVNCYLLPGEQLTLIDCGMDIGDSWEIFQTKLHENGFELKDIEKVILTHEHIDHVGMLPKILAHTNATIKAPLSIKRWFSHPEEMTQNMKAFAKKLYRSIGLSEEIVNAGGQFIEAINIRPVIEDLSRFEFFEAGDFLKMGHTQWEVLNTPGHCPTQFIFVQKEEKRVFSSDMLLPIAPMPIVTQDPNNPKQVNRALKDLLDSFARLRKIDFQKIYPGHGPIFSNANTVIDQQIARIQMRKVACLECYQSGHQTVYEIHQMMYPKHSLPPNFSGIHMIIGYLDLLKEEKLI